MTQRKVTQPFQLTSIYSLYWSLSLSPFTSFFLSQGLTTAPATSSQPLRSSHQKLLKEFIWGEMMIMQGLETRYMCFMCVLVCVHMCICVCAHACMCMCVFVCIHVCVQCFPQWWIWNTYSISENTCAFSLSFLPTFSLPTTFLLLFSFLHSWRILLFFPSSTFTKGLMYGYATDETEEMMPLTLMLAHKMNQLLAKYRRDGTLPWVGPDSKTQVRRRVSLMRDI